MLLGAERDTPPALFAPLRSGPPAGPLPEPGAYLFNRADGVVLLVQHDSPDGAPAHFLDNRQAAADILRAFGSDPSLLDTTPDPNPSPPTP
ncbi:MAG TPA: hypothetical protein VIM33_15075 [Gaiellaceae bacterium]